MSQMNPKSQQQIYRTMSKSQSEMSTTNIPANVKIIYPKVKHTYILAHDQMTVPKAKHRQTDPWPNDSPKSQTQTNRSMPKRQSQKSITNTPAYVKIIIPKDDHDNASQYPNHNPKGNHKHVLSKKQTYWPMSKSYPQKQLKTLKNGELILKRFISNQRSETGCWLRKYFLLFDRRLKKWGIHYKHYRNINVEGWLISVVRYTN